MVFVSLVKRPTKAEAIGDRLDCRGVLQYALTSVAEESELCETIPVASGCGWKPDKT